MVDTKRTVHIISFKKMIRLFHLFLIVNIIICSAGLCSSAVAFESSGYSTKKSCHEKDKHNSGATIVEDIDVKQNSDLYCCNDLLTNSAYDHDINLYYQDLPDYTIEDFNITKKYLSLIYRYKQGHDPPDVLILNSTFLI